jgi:hypothetical protein
VRWRIERAEQFCQEVEQHINAERVVLADAYQALPRDGPLPHQEPPSADQVRARYLPPGARRLGHGPAQRRTVPGCQRPRGGRQVAGAVGLANIHMLGHVMRFAKNRRRGAR